MKLGIYLRTFKFINKTNMAAARTSQVVANDYVHFYLSFIQLLS